MESLTETHARTKLAWQITAWQGEKADAEQSPTLGFVIEMVSRVLLLQGPSAMHYVLTQRPSAAEAQDSKARKWETHSDNVRRYLANHHCRGWVRGEELRHFRWCGALALFFFAVKLPGVGCLGFASQMVVFVQRADYFNSARHE